MNIRLPLQSISRGKIGRGGLCELLAAPVEDVVFYPAVNPLTQTLSDSIQLAAGKAWLAFSLTSYSKAFKEEMQSGKAGLFYNQIVSGVLTGQDVSNHLQLENMPHHRWIVLARERTTGITYNIGKPWAGANLSLKYDSSKGIISEIIFSNQSKHRAYIYGGTSVTTPGVTPNNTFLLAMLTEFRIGDPGQPADGALVVVSAALQNKPNIAVFVDGALLSSSGFADVMSYTYDPALNRIDFSRGLALKSIVQIYEVTA